MKGLMEKRVTEEGKKCRERERGRMTYEWFLGYIPSKRSMSGLWRENIIFESNK